MDTRGLKVIRCASCNRIIAEGKIHHGRLRIKCKCGSINTIDVLPKSEGQKKHLRATA